MACNFCCLHQIITPLIWCSNVLWVVGQIGNHMSYKIVVAFSQLQWLVLWVWYMRYNSLLGVYWVFIKWKQAILYFYCGGNTVNIWHTCTSETHVVGSVPSATSCCVLGRVHMCSYKHQRRLYLCVPSGGIHLHKCDPPGYKSFYQLLWRVLAVRLYVGGSMSSACTHGYMIHCLRDTVILSGSYLSHPLVFGPRVLVSWSSVIFNLTHSTTVSYKSFCDWL